MSVERLRGWLDERLSDPIWWNDVLQLAKTVLAAVAAWVIASSVLDLPQPFLAPWSALLVVHATVYRTFSKGTQQVAATVVAVLLATAVGETLGLTTGAIALLLVVALVLGSVPWLGAEATTIATTGPGRADHRLRRRRDAHLPALRHGDRGGRRPAGERGRVAAAATAYGRTGAGPDRRRDR